MVIRQMVLKFLLNCSAYSSNAIQNYGASLSAGDTIGVKFDADTRTLMEFLKNNTSQGTKTVPVVLILGFKFI